MKRTTIAVAAGGISSPSAHQAKDSSPSSSSTSNGVSNGDHHGNNNNDEDHKSSKGLLRTFVHHFHYSLFPSFLLVFTPNFGLVMWYTCVHCNGSLLEFVGRVFDEGPFQFFVQLWTTVGIFSPLSSLVILGFMVWTVALMVLVPGPRTEGPITQKGHIPVYKDNGFSCYVITMIAFVLLTTVLKLTGSPSPTIIYDHFGEFLGTMTALSYTFCLLLYVKGRLSPSTTDCGSSGNPIFDYFWGLELYPRIFGVDVKVFTNCRFGLTVWPLLVCIYTLKSYELHGHLVDSAWVSAALQLIYVTKFFWWESGYMRTMDIKLDRAGFYICWGCLVWVPGIYASVSLYLVERPIELGPVVSAFILFLGVVSCAVNYAADRQKQVVRRTDGNCVIWGGKPEVIRASFQLDDGQHRQSLLLVSGFWGIGRHFHYLPELALAFIWTVPVLFENLLPYSYFIVLCILLIHRTYRDDLVCKKKYAEYWDEYVRRVPYKIIPYVF